MRNRLLDVFKPVCRCLLVVVTLLSAHVHAQQEAPSAEALLAEMSRALRELNYSGTFSFEHGGMLETLKLVHRVVDGEEVEWLEHLNGPVRNLERRGLKPTCLTLSERLARGNFQSEVIAFNGLSQHYHFSIKGKQRVAGRQARVLHVVPRDEYRYGYTLFLDEVTSLPLLTMTLNNRRRVLERMQFSQLLVGDKAEQPGSGAAQMKQVGSDICDYMMDSQARWSLGWVPSGFVLTSFNKHDDKGESLSFTDGLSTFSVFLQPQSETLSYQGNAQRGASVVVMQQLRNNESGYTVSVVGEIPVVTAERVAASVQFGEG